MIERHCANCVFFKMTGGSEPVESIDDVDTGICYRFPPVPVWNGKHFEDVRPGVFGESYCGEFQPNKPGRQYDSANGGE